jgi:hypothetical protein
MRAPRFSLHLSAQCRRVGAASWRACETQNISKSGVLLCADLPLDVDAPVELRLKITPMATVDEPAEIWCRGRVVRAAPQVEGEMRTGYAVAIEQYDIVRAAAASLAD